MEELFNVSKQMKWKDDNSPIQRKKEGEREMQKLWEEFKKYIHMLKTEPQEAQTQDLVNALHGVMILIENKENLGFAGGCNRGIKWALKYGADYILLLNNDTVVATDFLDKMVETAEEDKKTGIVGSKIYYYDQPKKIWFGGGDFIKWRASGKHRFWQKKRFSKIIGSSKSDFITGLCDLN